MKAIILSLLTVSLLLSTTPSEREANLNNVVDIEIKHTQKIEKRISEITIELENKAKERAEKARLLEEKLKKRDEDLKLKADARDKKSKDSGL